MTLMPWGQPDIFIPLPLIITVDKDAWKNDKALKEQFAIAIYEGKNPFEAACLVFGKETNKALWASTNWINDPIINEIKQKFDELTETPKKLLDKEQFALKLLETAEETITYNGNEVYALDGKDRIATLKLYAETMGFINNKTAEINNNFTTKNNFMEIRFVEAEKKQDEIKVIDASPTIEPDILDQSPIKLKLVG